MYPSLTFRVRALVPRNSCFSPAIASRYNALMRYSLRSLTVVMLLIALALGWIVNHPWVEDKVAIEGTWQPTMMRRGYQNIGDHILKEERWTIAEGRFTKKGGYSRNRTVVSTKSVVEIRLNPKKHPKEIDAVVVEGPGMGTTEYGIYELHGDSLRICWGAPMRPRKFEWKEDDLNLYLVTYQRVKEVPKLPASASPAPIPPKP